MLSDILHYQILLLAYVIYVHKFTMHGAGRHFIQGQGQDFGLVRSWRPVCMCASRGANPTPYVCVCTAQRVVVRAQRTIVCGHTSHAVYVRAPRWLNNIILAYFLPLLYFCFIPTVLSLILLNILMIHYHSILIIQ